MNTLSKTGLHLIFILSIGLLSQPLIAQNTGGGKTGLGIMLGEPSGLSVKIWQNDRSAFQAGLAWSFGRNDAVYVHIDKIWHQWLDVENGSLAFYYGVGGRAVFTDDPRVGLRIPIGLNYLIGTSPVGFFLEVVPVLNIIPNTEGDGSGSIGLRFYF